MAIRRRLVLREGAAVRLLVSPVRQELLSAVGLHGPCSARELASHLGRSVTSLYYHLELLQRAGAISQLQRGQQVLWRAAAEQVVVASKRRGSAASSARTVTAAKAALRLTSRELEVALRDVRRRRDEPRVRLVALRAKAWLDETQLRELERHIAAINAVLRAPQAARRGAAIYAVTLVLAPVRERGARRR